MEMPSMLAIFDNRTTTKVEPETNLPAVPDLTDLQREQFADAQTRSHAERDHRSVAQGILSFRVPDCQFQLIGSQGGTTSHAFLFGRLHLPTDSGRMAPFL
jgi:hypothetical protein